MNPIVRRMAAGLALGGALLLSAPAGAEVIEEIVAWVDGDIITRSDLEAAEQALISGLYRDHTGAELDRLVNEQRAGLLQNLIDRQILINRAGRFFDLEELGESMIETVMEQQNIEDEAEFDRLLAQQGLTRELFKEQMVASFAPEEVIRLEVGRRVAVGDSEVGKYYEEHAAQYEIGATVTLREIVLLASGDDLERKRADAERLIERLRTPGTDFAELAQVYSEAGTRDAGGLLGPLPVADLSEDLARIATETPVGEIGGPFEMPYGFHIVRVEQREEAHRLPLEEVREDIRFSLENEEYEERLQEYLAKIRDEADWEVSKKYADSGRYRIAK